jgi:two-component system, cell cycle response regulator
MNEQDVLRKIKESDQLPTLSGVASKIITLASDPNTSARDIGNLASKDIALTTKILKVVNSSFFGFSKDITTVNQAVAIMGINAVRNLVLSFSIMDIQANHADDRFDYKKFWEKSLASAVTARIIGNFLKPNISEELFMAGLLQNFGQMLIAKTFPGIYTKINELSAKTDDNILLAEKEVLGTTHCMVGANFAKDWGLADSLLVSTQYHHNPETYTDSNKELNFYLNVVHISGLIADILYDQKTDGKYDQFKIRASEMIALSQNQIEKLLNQVSNEVEETAKFFDLKIDEPRSVTEILQVANNELSQLNLNYEQMNRELTEARDKLEKLTIELSEKNTLLEELANRDGLTKIYNHRYFQEYLDKELSRAVRYKTTLSLILIDIDHFKSFNDTYGHQVGDFVLKEVCSVSDELVRNSDLLARYGGEEFVIVLPETIIDNAKTVAEKLRKAIEEKRFFNEETKEDYKVTISLGIACFEPDKKMLLKNQLIEHADKALYVAKKNGRNRTVAYATKSNSAVE